MIWSSAAKKDLGKLQLVQNRAARLALQRPLRSNVNNTHVKLSWLKVAERLSASLLAFVRNMNEEKIPNCLYSQLTFSSNTHKYSTRHATRGLFKVPRARTQCNVQYCIEGWLLGTHFQQRLPKRIINQVLKNK